MRVYRFGGQGVKTDRIVKSETGKSHDTELFRTLLEEAGTDPQKSELERIQSEVNRLGEVLIAVQSLDAALAYRKAVKRYLDILVKGSLSVAAKISRDRYGKQKVYAVVQEVDEHLASLLDLSLDDQKDPLQILQIVGEVKGLLISLQS